MNRHRAKVSSFALSAGLLLLTGCQPPPGSDASHPIVLDPSIKAEVLERGENSEGAVSEGRTGEIIRNVTKTECQWLERELKKGETVYEYVGPTYGVIGESGVPVRFEKGGDSAFCEIPKNAVRWKANTSSAKSISPDSKTKSPGAKLKSQGAKSSSAH